MPDEMDYQRNPPHVHLAAVSLPAEQYALRAEVPVTRRTLCDGTHLVTPLAPLPVVFTFSGRLPAAEAAALPAMFTAAMTQHTRYAFDFCGASCTDMLLTAAECRADGKTAVYTVTMQGVISPAEEECA